MQYPEQVLGTTHGRTGGPTRRSSTTSTPRSSGTSRPTICSRESLFHEDLDSDEIKDRIAGLRRGEWVVQLPSTGFHEQKPEILTPHGHPTGTRRRSFQVRAQSEMVRRRSQKPVTASVATTTRSTSTAPLKSRAPNEREQEAVRGQRRRGGRHHHRRASRVLLG